MAFRSCRALVTALLLLGAAGSRVIGMPPPTPAMLKAYREDGSLDQRIAAAKARGNHRVDPVLVQNAQQRLRSLAARQGVPVGPSAATPPPAWRGLPTTGSPKLFVLLIDFSDYPADRTLNSPANIARQVFGDGGGFQDAPYESLYNFYNRSSYGQLTLTGNVLPYYRPAYTRASMPTSGAAADQARQALIEEAILAQTGHDFSQYDNNGTGVIDFFAVLWTGPDDGWANSWWAFQTTWSDGPTPFKASGKTLNKYVWQWVANAAYPTRNVPHFDPWILIHETGHALGLPDYYDYNPAVGPMGGLGGLDIMDGNWGDHNCFSKFLLGWITPKVFTSNASSQPLYAAGSTRVDNAYLVMDSDPGGNFGEYFMVQNRQRVGNDAGVHYPVDGLLLWHVDSRLDASSSDYLYDNSYTSHKLLALVQADGLGEIEKSSNSQADAGDYWRTGQVFGPGSNPSSARYDNSVTGMGLRNISAPGASMTLDIFKVTDSTPPVGAPSAPTATTLLDTMTFSWTSGTAADPDSGLSGYHLQVGTTPGGHDLFDGNTGNVLTLTLTDLGLQDGVALFARVCALNGAGREGGYSGNSAGLAVALPTFNAAILDNSGLVFKSLGPWTEETALYSVGTSCARSANIQDLGRTYLQARVTGPGSLSFDWRVSSEAGYDLLTLSLDGVAQSGPISGSMPAFVNTALAVPAGSHVVRWTYSKDEAYGIGSDAGWVDNVQWNGTSISPSSYVAVPGQPVAYVATLGAPLNTTAAWTASSGAGSFSKTSTVSGETTLLTTGPGAGSFLVTATPSNAPSQPVTASLTLVPASSVQVSVTPPTATVTEGAILTVAAQVTLVSDPSVTWSLSGGAWSGTPGASASWIAPSAGGYTLTATSKAAPSRSASAAITVVPPPIATSLTATTLQPPYAAKPQLTATFSQGTGRIDPGALVVTSGQAFSVGPVTAATTFTLTVTNAAGSTASKTLTLTPQAVVLGPVSPASPVCPVRASISFSAAAAGGASNALTWTCSAGTFSGSTWVAPASAGAVTITATSVDDPGQSVSTTASVRMLVLDHASAIVLPGGSATFTVTGDLGDGVTWSHSSPATRVDTGLSSTLTVPGAAPLADLSYALTATDKKDPAQQVTATVTVRSMNLAADGVLDARDLLPLAAAWGKGPSNPANFKNAGTVDDLDLAALLSQLP